MAGAAITPPTTKAVEPSRSFFIILPLSLIRDWYVPKGLSDRRNTTRQYGRANRTLTPNEGQEMDAPAHDSPRTCGVLVTFWATIPTFPQISCSAGRCLDVTYSLYGGLLSQN